MSKVVQLLDMPCRICEGVVFVESDDGQLICEQCGTVCEVWIACNIFVIYSKAIKHKLKKTMKQFTVIDLELLFVEKYLFFIFM